MEGVYTPRIFASMTISRMVTTGDMTFPTSIDEVANLEMFTFDRKKRSKL
jgi:hypothetical protein